MNNMQKQQIIGWYTTKDGKHKPIFENSKARKKNIVRANSFTKRKAR